jgi:hypothetical protein
MVSTAKRRAKKHGVPFNIAKEDIEIPEFCPALKVRIGKSKGSSGPFSPTLDRIIPEMGYVRGNILVISSRANQIKTDATWAEIQMLADFYKEYIINNFGGK